MTDNFGWCLDGHCAQCRVTMPRMAPTSHVKGLLSDFQALGDLVCTCTCHEQEKAA